MRVIWTDLAVERLEDYADNIALDNPKAALKWAESIQKSVNKLGRFPLVGRVVPEIRRSDIRELIEGNYRIVYQIKEDFISVLTIRHSKQILKKANIIKKH